MASTKTRTKADADTTPAPVTAAPEEPTTATASEETRASGIGRLVDLHPNQLVRDPANVRKKNVQPTADLLASVAELGVQIPIGVRLLPDGTYGVFMGQRRMLAAQAAAKAAQEKDEPVRLVPAIVHEIKDSDDVEAVLLSLIENEHRAAMTETDKVEAVAQLSLLTDGNATRRRRAARALGLSADEVAAATRAKELKQETL
ncbi:ParB/RepB/Spo0J family partition protein, partial [Streptacidiphilus monticola]